MVVTPTTAALSVMRTFISAPSRAFTVSRDPSTASMVPRTRTVGGCCAHATPATTDIAVSEASSRRGSSEDIFGMVLFSQDFFSQDFLSQKTSSAKRENTAHRTLFQ